MEDASPISRRAFDSGNFAAALKAILTLKGEGIVTDYALCGAVVCLFYTEAIATYDIDLYAFLPSTGPLVNLNELYVWAGKNGYEPHGKHLVIHGIPVQVLASPDELTDEAIEQAITFNTAEADVRVMTPEYLAAIALATHRSGKDYERVRLLIGSGKVNLLKLEDLVRRFDLTAWWDEYKRRNE